MMEMGLLNKCLPSGIRMVQGLDYFQPELFGMAIHRLHRYGCYPGQVIQPLQEGSLILLLFFTGNNKQYQQDTCKNLV
jgi:hypothetical protein